MPRDGVARGGVALGLAAEVAAAAEATRELREAASSLSARREDDDDSLHRRAAVLDAEIRRLQGSLSAFDPPTAVDEEQSLNAHAAIYNSTTRSMLDERSQPRVQKEAGGSGTKKRKRPVTRVGCATAPSTPNAVHVDIQLISSPTRMSPAQKRSKRTSSLRSHVWKHFDIGVSGHAPIATCIYCGQIYACDRSTHGTSTLWDHLKHLCPKDLLKGQCLQKEHGTPKHSFSVEECREALAAMIIIDEMPFKTVEGVGFKRYSEVLQPRFDLPSRVTLARDCMQRYVQEKPKLKMILKNRRICLTTDTWTSNQNISYMSLTAHWIDDEWKLQKRVLNFCLVPDHKGQTLGKRVEECLLEWGIDRIFTITVAATSSTWL